MESGFCKSFSHDEYKAHLARLQSAMRQHNLDALLLSMPENIYYATGYKTWYSSSLFRPVFCLLGQEGEPFLILRILEKTTVQLYAWTPHVLCWGTPTRNLGPLDAKTPQEAFRLVFDKHIQGVRSVGLEAGDGLHYYSALGLLKDIIGAFPKVEFCDGTRAVQQARMVKTPWEVSRIRAACAATERAILEAGGDILPGKTTEKDVARGIASRMAAAGVDKISYLTVISGPEKASTFNAYATDRVLQKNDVVLVDISGHIDGYASDLTRAFYLGTPPAEVLAMAKASFESVLAGAKAFRPGALVSHVNQVCEQALKDAGYPDWVVHSSGHGIGLNVVEYPVIQDDSDAVLEAGMVFAIEQGVYPYDLSVGATSIYQTMRYEDQVMVTADGHAFLSGPGEPLYPVG